MKKEIKTMYGNIEYTTTYNEKVGDNMELKDTIDGMISDDYKVRFKAEYEQIRIRCHKLCEILIKDDKNLLNFKLTNKELLIEQYKAMNRYLSILEIRAIYEGIEL